MTIQTALQACKKDTLRISSDWGRGLDDIKRGFFHGIVQTSDGRVWVQNAVEGDGDASCILVFNAAGDFEKALYVPELVFPHGLEVYHHHVQGECLLHTDAKQGLILMDLEGAIVWHRPLPDFYALRWQLNFEPSNSAVSRDGRIFMADGYGSYFVSVFDGDGRELYTICGPSPTDGGSIHPHGIAVVLYEGREVLAVTECMKSTQDQNLLDAYNMKSGIKLFELDGTFLEKKELDCMLPRHFRACEDGYLIPDFKERVLWVDREFNLKMSIGSPSFSFKRACDVSYPFEMPHDCCILNTGDVLISEFSGRITKVSF